MISKQNFQMDAIKSLLEELTIEEKGKDKEFIENEKMKEKLTKIAKINTDDLISNREIIDQAKLRKQNVSSKLSKEGKKEFIECIKNGDFLKYKICVDQLGYSLFEELSKPKTFWTAIHFSMLYGNPKIIRYCIDKLYYDNKLEKGIQLETSDGKTPILLLIHSKNPVEQKLEMLEYLTSKVKVDLSELEKLDLQRLIIVHNEKNRGND